ncbi:GtrA family protein [Litchfieldia alkalitelluris]|uniref:GtrA family protein n=1 Tax=Litchfieldia alkalitelluris TaxID=304268 RepID=UPI0009980A05|nr:GtrA family protein [Litchfieldia alkalitelluris]
MYRKHKEVINYLVFGVLTTAINIITYTFLAKGLDIDYKISTTIAWFISVLFAYITNKRYVFGVNSTSVTKELVSFFGFRWLSYVLDILMMIFLVYVLQADDLVAKLIANVFVVIFNYIASKYYIFNKEGSVNG